MLDNEAPQVLKDAICEQEVDYKSVPKGQHRRNVAERAIQTFKSHFIGVLCGVSETFPMWMLDEQIPQVDMQINLLRFSNVAPNVCVWTKLNGQHDFHRHPLAPLGIDMHILEPPATRKSGGNTQQKYVYVGTSLEHYRYYLGWVRETRAVKGSESVLFKHKYITAPKVSPADAIVQVARQLADAIKGNIPPPLAKSGIDHIKELTNFLKRWRNIRTKPLNKRQLRTNLKPNNACQLRGCWKSLENNQRKE